MLDLDSITEDILRLQDLKRVSEQKERIKRILKKHLKAALCQLISDLTSYSFLPEYSSLENSELAGYSVELDTVRNLIRKYFDIDCD